MADDKRIDELTQATELNDDDLFVLQQQGEAKSLPGSVLKEMLGGGSGDDESATSAAESAAAAKSSAAAAAESAAASKTAQSAAESAAENAARAEQGTVDLVNSAADAVLNARNAQAAAETAKVDAEAAATAAESSQKIAANAVTEARAARSEAMGAKADAETAQDKAESAQAAAATSETNAGKSATAAANSATAASEAKEGAEKAEASAVSYANNASDAAAGASASASAASASASEAIDAADDAYQSALNAANHKNAAESYASQASSSESSAKNYAAQASTSASTAAISESNAATSATNAAASETAAASSASAAATSKSNAANSATSASNSATAAASSATTAQNAANQAKGYRDEVAEMVAASGITAAAVPEYWVDELAAKASAIQTAMEQAGRHKSAFLWYTDAHWPNGNSKVSPALLKYLYEHTPMNKVNFGGDIIGDSLLATRDDMEYLYEWRKAIKSLPNHHSVEGNHDRFTSDSVDYEGENYTYAFLLAPEESPDMVMGDGNYYYIDNPAEKTRYLYFAYITADQTAMMAQGQFFVDAIKGVPQGWHIVAISHRWWQYSASATPTTGSIPAYLADVLSVFDAYNARTSRAGSNYFTAQDFADAKGKVEFCIGGHIHVDYDIVSDGGIPIIITTSDTNQNRVPSSEVDSGTVGTTTEAAVFGIVADYTDANNTKINVIGVGRGTSRVVTASGSTVVVPVSISDITYSGDTTVGATINPAAFAYKVNYSDGSTVTKSGGVTVSPATIGVVGDNTVTVSYTEDGAEFTETVTIVGTEAVVANLFDKNDADILDTGRINSSGVAVAYKAGQLVTGYIEAKAGDTFTLTSDLANNANSYTGTVAVYDASKGYIGSLTNATTPWTWSDDHLTGTVTIPSSYNSKDYSGAAFVRFVPAYTDIDSIVITKA